MTCRQPIDPRRRLYTLLQVGRQQLGLDEDTYRAILEAHGAAEVDGRPSATTLSVVKLEEVLEHLKRLGFRPTRQRPTATTADWRQPRIDKIVALWCALADAGVVRDRSERAMLQWCARLTRKARLQWASTSDLNACVEGLKSWAQRERVTIE